MGNYDLSIVIPARSEQFLNKTVKDLLLNKRGKTQIIVGLDGQWPYEPIEDHPDVVLLHYSESIGQRAITNKCVALSDARYIMKLDAHCAIDEGMDVKMMEVMQDDWTMVPAMRNLHAFNWVCKNCGKTTYQGPKPKECEQCKGSSDNIEMDIVWIAKTNPTSHFYRFDNTLHFQYWRELGKREGYQGDLAETMSLQGSCFMVTRDKYNELNLCDEKHGSWGQQGVEVACKTWLSGGKVMVNKKTWYAHMFRTQQDFGFPYPNPGISKARAYSKDLWINNKWEKAIHPLSWLIDKFAPVPDWDMSVGILYYTDLHVDPKIMDYCQKQLKSCIGEKRLVSVSLKPIEFGDNLVLPLKRGILTLFKQILAGLKELDTDIVFFAEHDVLYHPDHFKFRPSKKDIFYYNMNHWQVRYPDGHALHFDHKALHGLCAYRETLIKEYEERVKRAEEGFIRNTFEPGTRPIKKGGYTDAKSDFWMATYPNVDIRHGMNLSVTRWSQNQFRDKNTCQNWQETDTIPYWGNTKELMAKIAI